MANSWYMLEPTESISPFPLTGGQKMSTNINYQYHFMCIKIVELLKTICMSEVKIDKIV